ncbi:MAG: hypothetical protein EAZ44_03750 [Cytophagia bacterium]|nr:MAG: hypothetical protein EAZ44_03750 [Cytophagia bacterium]TAG43805.1 MAG: hypothetical protein EAZ31_03490 [Cytophagia bacterium]
MPIEIKELTVRFVINEKSASSSYNQNNNQNKALKQEDKKMIIEECVEKVLEMLERKRDR